MPKHTLFTPTWDFPLERPHLGILLGNADVGAMIWGGGNTLKVTLGRPDFWDHRGGVEWSPEQTYSKIRETLEAKDEAGLKHLFPSGKMRPTIVPLGRLEFDLGKGVVLTSASLDLATGVASIKAVKRKIEVTIKAVIGMDDGVIAFAWPRELTPVTRMVPAWESIRPEFDARGLQAPLRFSGANFGGWVQTLPQDPACCCAWATEGRTSVITVFRTEHGDDDEKVLAVAESALCHASAKRFSKMAAEASAWWKAYWKDVPALAMPNATLKLLHDYGMYKFACASRPGATPCTLQGPWIEDYQFPPWSSDYHFNINVQMCYWPAFHGNKLSHLLPLFKMIRGWLPLLRENAKRFIGIEDGIMLPHAVDDQCRCMGNFWTGMMDHGCTMWIAEMMFRYFKYSGDKKFLRTDAFPFMRGAMNVFVAMLEEGTDGSLALPVGVSPEFRAANPDAWGRNPSFQLACAHRLAEDLESAATVLGEKTDPVWGKVLTKLPKVSIYAEDKTPIIGLWDGLKLNESHRHHSHLAAIAPFDTIDCESLEWAKIVDDSLMNWIGNGPGLWSGWCVPWASMIHTRVGNATMAELWLDIWERMFTNEGHGTLHDANACGISLMGKRGVDTPVEMRKEIMQLDAGMGCVAAIHEMLLHDRRGVNYIFRGAPQRWQAVSFKNMLASGGVLVSAERKRGRVLTVTLEATFATVFKLADPFDGAGCSTEQNGKRGSSTGSSYTPAEGSGRASGVIEFKFRKGDKVQLTVLRR